MKNIEGISKLEHARLYDELINSCTFFEEINDFVSFGITGNVAHIHTIPIDLRPMISSTGFNLANLRLIDALRIIREIISEKDISYIYATSSLLRLKKVRKALEELSFKVVQVEEDSKDEKPVYQAFLYKDNLLSESWENGVQQIETRIIRGK